MECRKLRGLQQRISQLGPHEHGVLLAMVEGSGVKCAKNNNGYFFNMSTLDEELLARISDFVDFSISNNRELERYDRDVHEKVQLLQRVTPAEVAPLEGDENAPPKAVVSVVKLPAVAVASAPRPRARAAVSKTTGAAPPVVATKSTKMAFVRRANDTPKRKVAHEAVDPEPPVFVGVSNSE